MEETFHLVCRVMKDVLHGKKAFEVTRKSRDLLNFLLLTRHIKSVFYNTQHSEIYVYYTL